MKLDPVLRRFFDEASALKLSKREKSALRASLAVRMAVHAGDLHLTDGEMVQGKQALRRFMRAHPSVDSSPSWIDVLRSLLFSRMPALALSAVIVVVGSGVAVASASESALPGDALYTVKVEVMEPLRERMMRSPEERVAWKVRKVERRLAEARALLQGDSLTESRRGLIEEAIVREVRALQASGQGMDMDTVIASQQVLEETMDNAIAGDLDVMVEHPQWRHLRSFVHARRSDVHAAVRERLQTAYGIGGDSTAAATSAPVSAAAKTVDPPESIPMPVPASQGVAAEDTDEPRSSAMMMNIVPTEESASSQPDAEGHDEGPRKRRMQQGNDESQEGASRLKDADEEEEEKSNDEDSGNKEEDVPTLDTTVLRETAPSAPLPYVDEEHGEEQEREKRSEEVIGRLKEKREHIEEQLRGFREGRGLLR